MDFHEKEKHAFFRAMGSAILEHTAELFPSSSDEQAEMQNIVASAKRAASSGNNKELIDCFSSVSHSTYLKMMAQWHFMSSMMRDLLLHYAIFRLKQISVIWLFEHNFYTQKIILCF